MPVAVVVFLAQDLVFINAVLAAAVVTYLLYKQPRAAMVSWVLAVVIVAVLGGLAAEVAGIMYVDPRPFAVEHTQPLIPHVADNGFPSDHALLAAAIVAGVFLVSAPWSVPFAVLAALVDYGRVATGLHHAVDVIGSSLLVAVSTGIAAWAAPWLRRRAPTTRW